MNLICLSHKRKCEYICLNPQCYIQNKDFDFVCPQCVLNGKHKSHDVVDYFLFVDSIHNTINTDININQYQQKISEEIQKQVQIITKYLMHQQNIIQSQLRKLCYDLNREKKQALQTLNVFEKIINQQDKQERDKLENFRISQFDMQRLIHMYNGKIGIDYIIQSTQKELQTVMKAIDNIASEEHYFNDLTQTFQNTNYLINSPKKINTIDIISKQNNLGLQRQNSLSFLIGKKCFCQIDLKCILVANQGFIKLIDVQTQTIKNIFQFIKLRSGFDVEINKVQQAKGIFFYYNKGQTIVEIRSIYDKQIQKVLNFNFCISSCFIQKNLMYLGSTLGEIFVFNYKAKRFVFQFKSELPEIVISLQLLQPNILLVGQIEDFESGRVSIIDLSTRQVIKQFTQYPDIELENYVLELIKVNSLSFICGFGDLRLYKLNPFKNTLLNQYSFEWELFHDSQIYRNRFLFLKEIDFLLVYDLTQDKVVHQISISSFLTQRVIGLYFIQNSLVIISDRGKIDILTLNN
ncbi:hypothetical protein ABPG72_013333 [Tetrahymena utriculariae]